MAATSQLGTIFHNKGKYKNFIPVHFHSYYPEGSDNVDFYAATLQYKASEHFPISILEKDNGNLIFGNFYEDNLGLGKYLFNNWETGESKLFGTWDPESHTLHIIRPIWLLLSFLSLGLYGFIFSKSDEEVTELLKQTPETAVNPGPSALSRTSIFMSIMAVSQLLIFFSLLIFGYFTFFTEMVWPYFRVDSLGDLFKGYIFQENMYYDWETDSYESVNAGINPLSYLYIPSLIATVALAYYTRIKNAEENPEYPGTEEAPEIQSFGISAYGASKLKEAKDLLDSGIITEEEFQQMKEEYLQ